MIAVEEGEILEDAQWDLDFVQMVVSRIEGGKGEES